MTDFGRALGALERENPRRWLFALGLATGLVGLWLAWICLAQFSVYLVTSDARLEATNLVHPVRVEVEGRIDDLRVRLDRRVQRGDVLFTLESEASRLTVEEAEARVAANEAVLRNLERLEAAQRAVIEQIRVTRKVALNEAAARSDEARVAAEFSALESERWRALYKEGAATDLEMLRNRAQAEGTKARAKAEAMAARRVSADHQTTIKERRVEIERLRMQMSERRQQLVADRALIRRLRIDIEKRQVRAPVTGKVGWLADLSPGLLVQAGDRVASIVPGGQLRIVAYFPAREAIGRIRAGQPAVLRLNAYPWTQYGAIEGRVARVASEPEAERLRVEADVDPTSFSSIPHLHGLKGALDVAVERVAPATLLLRSVGRLVSDLDVDRTTEPETEDS